MRTGRFGIEFHFLDPKFSGTGCVGHGPDFVAPFLWIGLERVVRQGRTTDLHAHRECAPLTALTQKAELLRHEAENIVRVLRLRSINGADFPTQDVKTTELMVDTVVVVHSNKHAALRAVLADVPAL